MFVNYAHRGASAYAPENTMSSFRKALEIGGNGIELDLQKTKDNKIVIFHDNTIDKKSNGIGKISDYTYNELQKIQGNQICPPADLTSKEGIKLARENNLSIRLWKVSTLEIMEKAYNLDIDGMTVNFPDKLKELMEREN